MSKEQLSDWEWDNEEEPGANDYYTEEDDTDSVVMLHTFNTENEAHVCAATLQNEGIDAQIVTSTTGQMTPFAYGNVRLFVAKSQEEKAKDILLHIEEKKRLTDVDTKADSTKWVVYVVIGLAILFVLLGILLFF